MKQFSRTTNVGQDRDLKLSILTVLMFTLEAATDPVDRVAAAGALTAALDRIRPRTIPLSTRP
jgi:hypothetical protein